MNSIIKLIIIPLVLVSLSFSVSAGDFEVEWPNLIIEDVSTSIQVHGVPNGDSLLINDQYYTVSDGAISAKFEKSEVVVSYHGQSEKKSISLLPLWLSILPPLLAIGLALITKEVITSLFAGILIGSCILGFYSDGFIGIFTGFFDIITTYILSALNDSGHLSVITFSIVIGGIVALISRNGGMRGVVNRITHLANTARNGQLVTWTLGVGVFFDDYANTLVVGNTMRNITDRLRISREKLAYIVDSTAAPIAAIAFVTTWIGAELGYIGSGIDKINAVNDGVIQEGVYSIFLQSLAYSYYPVFTLVFILMLILMKRDFGPMYKAESRARTTGEVNATPPDEDDAAELNALAPKENTPLRARNAVIPILIIVFGTLFGLLVTGFSSAASELETIGVSSSSWSDSWSQLNLIGTQPETTFQKIGMIIGLSDSYAALLWSSMLSLIVALLMTVSQRILTLQKSVDIVITGFKTMISAIMILVLAWSLAAITENMHTAEYLSQLVKGNLPAFILPLVTFVLSALVAFSTGSSWSTMSLIYPLILPLAWEVTGDDGGYSQALQMEILYNCTASVLAGSVLGDHCSPISDTTILSSLASSCNHIDHVNTQLPYALTVGCCAMLFGVLPGALGVPFYINFPLGIAAMYFIIRYLGKAVPDYDPSFEDDKINKLVQEGPVNLQ